MRQKLKKMLELRFWLYDRRAHWFVKLIAAIFVFDIVLVTFYIVHDHLLK